MKPRLIAIEGEEPFEEDSSTFMRELAKRVWLGKESVYVNWTSAWRNAEIAAERASGAEAVFLAGYGHGGAAAIVAAQLLAKAGQKVDCLLLFDAVSILSGLGYPGIPDNVALTVHGRRHPASMSRPELANCGLQAPGEFKEQIFWVTHSGACGQLYLIGGPMWGHDKFVEENGKNTLVTRSQDYEGAKRLWGWMCVQMHSAYYKATEGDRTGRPGVVVHKVDKGESLSVIAGLRYHDVLLWPLIYDANVRLIGPDPNRIQPGQQLVIPLLGRFSRGELDAARRRGLVC